MICICYTGLTTWYASQLVNFREAFLFSALDSCTVYSRSVRMEGQWSILSLSYWSKYNETRLGQNPVWTAFGQCAPEDCLLSLTLTLAIFCIYFSINHKPLSCQTLPPSFLSLLIRVFTSVTISSSCYSPDSSLMSTKPGTHIQLHMQASLVSACVRLSFQHTPVNEPPCIF